MRPRRLFGQVAIRRGHVNPAQLEKALDIQKQMSRRGDKRLLGMVMLEKGIISNEQLIDILRCMEVVKTHSLDVMADKLSLVSV